MKYMVVIKESDEGYSISCPALPGCWSQGKTEAEAVTDIGEAIEDYLVAISEKFTGENCREIETAL